MNTGFAGGINIGIKHSKGDLILFLNSDIVHEPDFLMEMLNFFKNKKVHIAQPKICYYNDKNKIWQNGGKINLFS
ncbi:hypothetical protein LCGC14_3117710, partial [marine sediment metagenome]